MEENKEYRIEINENVHAPILLFVLFLFLTMIVSLAIGSSIQSVIFIIPFFGIPFSFFYLKYYYFGYSTVTLNKDEVLLQNEHREVKIDIHSIAYLTSSRAITSIHTADSTYTIRPSAGESIFPNETTVKKIQFYIKILTGKEIKVI